jgi:hypothetical protein
MVRFYKKFYFFKVYENWFTYKFRFLDLLTLNSHLHLKNIEQKKVYGVRNDSHTVELNLEQDVDTIYANFRNTVKQEIRKSEKEGVVCDFRQDNIDEFVQFYNDFAHAKKIYPTSKNRIIEMGDSLKMSYATLDGQLLVAHSYLVDEEVGIARLFHSASKRLDETVDRNVIGRANKLLTYKDILYFKEKGYKILDFGGYLDNAQDKSMQGINEFKMSFGGEKVTCINYNSFLYYILKKAADKIDWRY